MAKRNEQGASWSDEQINNARIIAQVGRQLGASSRDIQIALMTAFQESGLRNLDYGDRDSVGLFQQRNAWGSTADRMNPAKSAKMFFTGGAQGQRGLFDIKNRNSLELWQAAQKVQVSAFPRAYAKWEGSARALMGKLGNVGGAPVVDPEEDVYKLNPFGGFETNQDSTIFGGMPQMGLMAPTQQPEMKLPESPLTPALDKILNDGFGVEGDNALTESPTAIGLASGDKTTDYTNWSTAEAMLPELDDQTIGSFSDTYPSVKGGSDALTGQRSMVLNLAKQFIGTPYKWGGTQPGGFDCSGLLQYVFKQAGMNIPRLGRHQGRMAKWTDISKIKAGDFVYWPGQHIALYLGGGKILEAPRAGLSVRIRSLGEWSKDADAVGVPLSY